VRTFVLILLVALLPLRLWAAEGMAIRMAQADVAAAQAVPGQKANGQAAMPDDCPMMAKVAPAGAGPDDAPATSDHGSCLTCQLCAAIVAAWTAAPARHAAPVAPPDRATDRFASADPLREHKPPIA
jgi:hypothetical protein